MKNLKLIILFIISIWTVFTSCKNSIEVDQTDSAEMKIKNPEWVIDLISAYKALYTEKSITSANLLLKASELMPKKNWENYFMAATIYAVHDETDDAFKSLDAAIESGLRDVELLSTYPDLDKLKDHQKWIEILERTNEKKLAYIRSIKNPEILTILEQMWAADQKALNDYEENIRQLDSTATHRDYDVLFKPIEVQWDENRLRLDSIIEIHGWPGNSLVGEDGAKLAWSVPQHHPDVFYKKKCLELIKASLEKGDVDPNQYAELNDRIARETWQKQTYGASMAEKAPYPIYDPINVNMRRIELGLLEPVEVYAYYHGIEYNIPFADDLKAVYDQAQSDYSKFRNLAISKKADSAYVYITKAIQAYGDISNDNLYEAAIELGQLNDERSAQLSLKILKVLIWREWEFRFERINSSSFKNLLNENDWGEIERLMSMSR